MPQARRKTPFSGKAKKQQLQNKKQNKTLLLSSSSNTENYDVLAVNYQPNRARGRGESNRYALKFYRESDAEMKIKREEALKELKPVSPDEMETDPTDFFPPELSFPKRPPWDYNMSPAQLDAQEQRYFREYVSGIQASELWKDMSYFELNLETWRQLWRVLEMCDILLLIVDVRYAGMMFPPSLYEFVVKEQKKDMIVVLNKVDLVPASVAAAWSRFLRDSYPGLRVVYFTSCPSYNLAGPTADKAGLQVRRRKGRQRMCAEGATQILEACKEIVGDAVDLSSWETKIREESGLEFDDGDVQVGEQVVARADTAFHRHERLKDGVVTVGCVGQPNVGKSSLLNALMGRKVVSVSRTPGHTKHFQTIFLTPRVRLCDCPGLVFPSRVPRAIQILMGSYPIAQLREPYTAVRFVAERLPLPRLLRVEHPAGDEAWSPRDVCEAWARKRGFVTAKAARLDAYRAANDLLRMALDGKIGLWLPPPGFFAHREQFEKCKEVEYIKWVRALSDGVAENVAESVSDSEPDSRSDDDEEGSESASEGEAAALANQFAALADD